MGMDPNSGEYRLLDEQGFREALGALQGHEVLVQGTPDEVAAMSTRIKLGNKELQNRAARRKQQRQSRRANRGR